MDKQNLHLLLRIPRPDKRGLSFCEPTTRDLKRWLDGLPKANLGETARQLYQCLAELGQLVTPAENRLQLLELLRGEVYAACQHLSRHFLNQAIVLDERPRKIANLCQALQNHLAAGYKLIVAQEARHGQPSDLLGIALQRATHALCAQLVRSYQLYCPAPEGLWLELHRLYLIARAGQRQQRPVADGLARHGRALSVEQTYLVALLLGCARCNQMRQAGIAQLAEALEAWSPLVTLQPAELPSSLFAVATQVDGPPRYKTLFNADEIPSLLGIAPQRLVESIRHYLRLPVGERQEAGLPVPDNFSQDLLQQLASTWGDIAQRTFQRTPGQGSLTICVGMSALHYYLAGGRHFSDVLARPDAAKSAVFKPIVHEVDDAWSNAFDAQPVKDWEKGLPFEEIQYSPARPGESRPEQVRHDDYPTYPLSIVNHSPGGYCLLWSGEVPSQLQAGELLGIQDAPGQSWSIALVRWVRQVRGGGTQMGIELLAPHAQPCGLQLLRGDQHNSQFLRALLLPEIRAISRPASLLTPRLPFQEGNRVLLNLDGEEHRAVLSRKQTGSGSFSQFEYRYAESRSEAAPAKPANRPESVAASASEDDFDSIWKSL